MLIKEYCGVEYEIKGEMHNLMSINPYLWKERPINEKLNFYAGNDVIYLPKIYNIICSNTSLFLLTSPTLLYKKEPHDGGSVKTGTSPPGS